MFGTQTGFICFCLVLVGVEVPHLSKGKKDLVSGAGGWGCDGWMGLDRRVPALPHGVKIRVASY